MDSSSKGLVLYRLNDGWHKFFITNGGDIEEAYLSFIVQHQANKFSNGITETNIHIYLIEGVANVDNAPGFIQADIESKQFIGNKILNIRRAAKSAGASVMGLTEATELLNKLADLPTKITDNDNNEVVNRVINLLYKDLKPGTKRNYEVEAAADTTAERVLQNIGMNNLEALEKVISQRVNII